MEELDVYLTADNSSGKQRFILNKEKEGSYWFTLVGEYEGKDIQIDFTDSTLEELMELKAMIEIICEEQE